MLKILFLLLITLNLIAGERYSLRVASTTATNYDLGQIVIGKIGEFYPYSNVYSVDGGYLLKSSTKSLPFDFYLKSGVSYFEQNPSLDPIYEMTIYIKAYYNIDFLANRVRFGFGEGGSYTSGILEVEREDAISYNDNNSHFLNYLDISLDFDLAKLLHAKSFKELYVGALIKHRSGIFGLINNVRHGGSNHVGFYIEKNF